jgi:UDPglucose 6-dehydrogenase
MPPFRGVRESNDLHRGRMTHSSVCWARCPLSIAVLGLTYKPGTDTLRRSPAVDLCKRLIATGARVIAHDPAVRTPLDYRSISWRALAVDALSGAQP